MSPHIEFVAKEAGPSARRVQERWLEPGAEYVQQEPKGSPAGVGPTISKSSKSEHRQNYELGIGRDFAVLLSTASLHVANPALTLNVHVIHAL